jgi:hypothetical protein
VQTDIPLFLLVAALVGLTSRHSAEAATLDRTAQHQTAQMCQMSLPSVDNKILPRATGYRNDGTTNVFVICGFPSPEGGMFTAKKQVLWLVTTDGQPHSVTCTGVNADHPGHPATIVYSTWTVDVTKGFDTGGNSLLFEPVDFGSTDTVLRPSFSVTCNLPPNVSVNDGYTYSTTDVGS